MNEVLTQTFGRRKISKPKSAALVEQRSDRSNERELILLCARSEMSKDEIFRASFLLSLSPDWNYLLGIANRNGVLPLVSKNISPKLKYSLDGETRKRLDEFGSAHLKQSVFVTGKLIEIVQMLQRNGISALPFKGPTLAMRAYNSLVLRQFVDLDILVKPKDFDRAVQLFLRSGFEPYANSPTKRSNALFINRKKDIGLISQDGSVRVELHWKLSGSFFALPFELNELWERLETTELGGVEIKTLPFNDLFVYLCLHGARHGFEKLGWICDLCELIRSENEIDWQQIHDHAAKHGCTKVVELGLFLAFELFGVTTAYPSWNKIKNDPLLRENAVRITEKIFSEKFSTTEPSDWYQYYLFLKEKETDKLKVHLHYIFWYFNLVIRPNAMDKAVFSLPKALYPLYYVLRPFRLLFGSLRERTLNWFG